jgi:hypothetical protein
VARPDTTAALRQELGLTASFYSEAIGGSEVAMRMKKTKASRRVHVEGKGFEYDCPVLEMNPKARRTHKVTDSGEHTCLPLQAILPTKSSSCTLAASKLLPPAQIQVADLFCEGWAAQQPVDVRAVHFVRSPVAMAVSAFLYHSQANCPEAWQYIKPPHPDAAVYSPDRCVRALRPIQDRKNLNPAAFETCPRQAVGFVRHPLQAMTRGPLFVLVKPHSENPNLGRCVCTA